MPKTAAVNRASIFFPRLSWPKKRSSPVLPRRSTRRHPYRFYIKTAMMGWRMRIMSPTREPFPVVQVRRDFAGF